MPVSNPDHLPQLIHFAQFLRPASVLDIGVGMGNIGMQLRNYCDISSVGVDRALWLMKIDGVEIFEGYRNPIWEYAYNTVYIEEAMEAVDRINHYSMILLNDIVEHFEHSDAVALMRTALDKTDVLVVTTPAGVYPQDAWGGNEAERHRCVVRRSDVPEVVFSMNTGVTDLYVCGHGAKYRSLIAAAGRSCPRIYRNGRVRRGIDKLVFSMLRK